MRYPSRTDDHLTPSFFVVRTDHSSFTELRYPAVLIRLTAHGIDSDGVRGEQDGVLATRLSSPFRRFRSRRPISSSKHSPASPHLLWVYHTDVDLRSGRVSPTSGRRSRKISSCRPYEA